MMFCHHGLFDSIILTFEESSLYSTIQSLGVHCSVEEILKFAFRYYIHSHTTILQ